MIIQHGYQGSSLNQELVFADGGLPEVMSWLQATREVRGASVGGGAGTGSSDFNGYSTWDDVVRMACDGWSEGAKRITDEFPMPTFSKDSRRPHWDYDVVGELPDVDRYLSGDPAHMRRRKVVRGRRPVVTLYIGMGVRATVSTTEFTNFGVAVCQLIDTLEHHGVRVELNQLTRADMNGGLHVVTGWRVKEASAALDMAAVAFTYMHPAAHRRLQFQMRARIGKGNSGSSESVRYVDFPDAPPNAIIFAGISDNPGACRTLSGARNFLRLRINEGAGEELIDDEMVSHLEGEEA